MDHSRFIKWCERPAPMWLRWLAYLVAGTAFYIATIGGIAWVLAVLLGV